MTQDTQTAAAQYLADQLCHRQWKAVLSAIAVEFNDYLSEHDAADLMSRIGVRFAQANPLIECQTLRELQHVMNQVWSLYEWGEVSLISESDSLYISHRCSPLMAAFGPDASNWSVGFLQGVYQEWLDASGATTDLSLHLSQEMDSWGCLEFRLGR